MVPEPYPTATDSRPRSPGATAASAAAGPSRRRHRTCGASTPGVHWRRTNPAAATEGRCRSRPKSRGTPCSHRRPGHRPLTTLREKLVKIGAKVISHVWYVTFQLAEVAMPRSLFHQIRSLMDDLRRRPFRRRRRNRQQVKTTAGVCLNGGELGQMAFSTRADHQNQAIGWLLKGCSSLDGGTMVRFPRF